jgi:hypothetical protein
MEHHTLKNANNCLNTNIYSYLETSGGQSSNLYLNVVHFFNTSVIPAPLMGSSCNVGDTQHHDNYHNDKQHNETQQSDTVTLRKIEKKVFNSPPINFFDSILKFSLVFEHTKGSVL